MKSINTNMRKHQHGHNAPWMLPIWGVISFVGLNSLLLFGTVIGTSVFLLFTSAVFSFLAKNKDRMPITIRPDTFEYYQNMRKNDPEFYNYLKSELSYFTSEIADFEYVEKVRKEAKLKSKKNFINLHHRKRIELTVFN